MSSSIASVIASRNRRKMIKAFRKAQATSVQSARSLSEIGLHESLVLQIQKSRGVIVEAEPGRYYLDEEREAGSARFRRMLIVTVLILTLIIAAYIW